MKKSVCLILLVVMLMAMVVGCGNSSTTAEDSVVDADITSAEDANVDADEKEDETTPEEDVEEPVLEKIELRLGHGNAVDQSIHIHAQMWADKVAEMTDGRITITVYPAGQLGTLVEMLEAVELGTLDICCGDASLLSSAMPEYGIFSLPFIIADYDQAETVFDGDIGAELNEKLATEHNIRPLSWWWNGYRIFCTTTPIETIEDCKGIKLRSPEAQIYVDTFTALGMKPTPIPWGDVYSSFQSGVVDGMETTTEAMCTQAFDEIGGNVCNSRHMISVVGPTISETVWQSLSEEDQEILITALEEVTQIQRADTIEKESGFLTTMADRGTNITEFTDKQALVDLYTPYWTEYAQGCGAEDYLARILEMF